MCLHSKHPAMVACLVTSVTRDKTRLFSDIHDAPSCALDNQHHSKIFNSRCVGSDLCCAVAHTLGRMHGLFGLQPFDPVQCTMSGRRF